MPLQQVVPPQPTLSLQQVEPPPLFNDNDMNFSVDDLPYTARLLPKIISKLSESLKDPNVSRLCFKYADNFGIPRDFVVEKQIEYFFHRGISPVNVSFMPKRVPRFKTMISYVVNGV